MVLNIFPRRRDATAPTNTEPENELPEPSDAALEAPRRRTRAPRARVADATAAIDEPGTAAAGEAAGDAPEPVRRPRRAPRKVAEVVVDADADAVAVRELETAEGIAPGPGAPEEIPEEAPEDA